VLNSLLRALIAVLLVATGALAHAPASAAQSSPTADVVSAAAPAPASVATAEDADLQVRTLNEAYELLMDRYVHPLDSAALLHAAWDELVQEADSKAVSPGATPPLTGDRASDLTSVADALGSYLAANSMPDGFVPVHALIRGMVRFVDEGHTYFLDPQQYQDYQSWSRGDNRYVGIGISVNARDGEPRIVEVYEDTPADRAGLRAGDIIQQIDDRSAQGLALEQMTSLVRGPVGSTVTLVVRRGDDPNPITVGVERAEIHLQFVKQRLLGDDIGYVMLRGFPEPSVVDTIEQDMATFQSQGVRGLVLDLRGNSGGRLDVGTRLLNHFLPSGSSLYAEIDRDGRNRVHMSRAATPYKLPVVVLVDGGTASMGEIFASAVQEHGVATVVGSSTAGSVAAAQVFGLPDGAGLQVTVFEIVSADGKQLNRVGVTPDEVVQTAADPASGDDAVLSRALEILQDQGASRPGAIHADLAA
jgi:carboxyl-terminal processing protease